MRSFDPPALGHSSRVAGSAFRFDLSTLSFQHVLIALAVLTAVRIVGLHFSVVDLFMDEAQYWAWSRELAYGYFSKPPLLAWIIAATDQVCGNGEACVRLASPLLHLATSLIVYAIAKELYGQYTAAWAALAYGFGLGVVFSARIISTDVPLLLFWAVALLAYLKLTAEPDWRWAIVFGLAFGLGILAKYAMVYFLLGIGCAAWFDRDSRTWLTRPQTWTAFAIAGALVLPNLAWNAANDFITFKHTGDNIAGGGLTLRPQGVVEFVGAQFAVAGPFVFATFLYLLVRLARNTVSREDGLMLAFAIPPLALVTALSFFRDAHANWAAPAIVSMTIVAAAWWQRHTWKHWLGATLGLGLGLQILLVTGDAFADRLSIPVFGKQVDPYRRTLGWRALGERAAEIARAEKAKTVGVEGRSETAALVYGLRDQPVRTVSWPVYATPDSHFDLTRPLDNTAEEPVLFISSCLIGSRLQRFYEKTTPLGPVTVSSGPSSQRQYHAFLLEQRRRDIEPIGPCAEATLP
jgi:hypothetical protein